MEYECKVLKPYKSMEIEKTYLLNKDGTIKKDSILYTAYGEDDGGLYDADKTLAGIKRKIDIYTR